MENARSAHEDHSNEPIQEDLHRKRKVDEPSATQLQVNIIPPYFISLENLFNRHDAYIKKKRLGKCPTTVKE